METKFYAQDQIEAVRAAKELEDNADEYCAGDTTAPSGRHWVVLYGQDKEYPYGDLEVEFFEWCLSHLPENSEAAKVWNSNPATCADDYHAIGEWAEDMLNHWYYADGEERTDEEQEVYDVLFDIAQQWQNTLEW